MNYRVSVFFVARFRKAANSFANILRVWNGEQPLWTAEFEAREE